MYVGLQFHLGNLVGLWCLRLTVDLRPEGIVGSTVKYLKSSSSSASGTVGESVEVDKMVTTLKDLHGDVFNVCVDVVYGVVGSGWWDLDGLISGLGVPRSLLEDSKPDGYHERA